MRVCPTPGCPTLVPPGTYRGLCPTHAKAREQQRGTREARGYDHTHRTLRAQWATRLTNGHHPPCPRCGHPVTPNTPWHLGHTDDRTGYHGPEHDRCNLSAAGKASHQPR